ncbi:uncharacterized protein LOC125494762 [Beta vulgaris subsp. vulgaris]|uniref:uncharacterized protein LOC125494762 n=1 Tax=Beta vulgaris subsp. vulgaris TaxID=3555 RepID=UPI002546FF85|nr:uncharacterized protein LOC125494762 [Beta vulgaris subsp. vulgaris]
MLFFQISPGREAAEPLKGKSQEGRPGTSRPPRPELYRPPSKGKQPAVSEPRRKIDWKLVVRPGDNIPPTGCMMETDAREYLEAKRAVAFQRSASGSTPYMKDPSLRVPSKTAGRSHGPSAIQPRIMESPPFPKVKLPTIEPFDGTTDPDDHLSAYKHQMYVQGVDDATWCKNFLATLKGVAQKWFNNLSPNSVNNFTELSILFTSHFVANRQEQKTNPDLNAGVAFDAFIRGLRPGSFKFDLVKKKITTLTEALKEAEAFIHATEVCAEAKQPEAKKTEEAIQPKKSLPKKAETWAMTTMTTSSKRSRRSEPAASVKPIEFNKAQYSILMEIKDQHELKAPTEMKTPYRNRDKSKYCHFHKDCGHETNECKHLKRALEDLARKGKMNSYLPLSGRKFQKKDNRQGRRKDDESTDEDVVMVISGGFAAGGPTTRGHKNYLRELSQVMLTNQAKTDPFPKIVVSDQDRGKIRTPHDDPLMVEMKIANLRVRRILIDTGSSTDIISADCLSRLKFDENDLVPVNHPIIGLGGGVIHSMMKKKLQEHSS